MLTEMIHEKQIRQLCAIHSVNNLLQIPPDLIVDDGDDQSQSEEETSSDVKSSDHDNLDEFNDRSAIKINHEWRCNGRALHRYKQNIHRNDNDDSTTHTTTSSPSEQNGSNINNKQLSKKHQNKRSWQLATQQEFDNIAKEFTLREIMLLQGDESTFLSATSATEEMKTNNDNCISQEDELSMCQRICSQYGTPYFGNYSLDVLEEALKRRHVELKFYRVPPSNDTDGSGSSSSSTALENGNSNERKDVADNSNSNNLIGLIIYEKEQNERNTVSMWRRIGSRLPLVKTFFGTGEHWFTITCVKYRQYQESDDASSENNSSNTASDAAEDDGLSWCLIDSKLDDVCTFDSDNELLDYLREVQQDGGLVFQASMRNVSDSKATNSK